MSFNKYLKILILLTVLLILNNAIYATDTENTTTPEETNTINKEVSNVNTYNNLRDTITKIKSSNITNHEINLKQNTYKLTNIFTNDLYSSTPHNITINGNHSIIDGQNKYSFLRNPLNAVLNINNLTIINTKSEFGPALTNSGMLILENVNFENNRGHTIKPTLGGGAIYTDSSIYITNCSFKNNGEHIDGSTIYINENTNQNNVINIINCTFQNNTSLQGSTIKLLGQTITNIQNSTFINENANDSIIKNTLSQLNITNCSFINENSSNIINNDNECNINNILIYDNNINNTILTNRNLVLNNSKIYNNKVNTILKYCNNATIENTSIYSNYINETLIHSIYNENNTEISLFKSKNMTIQDNTANKTCGIKNEYENSRIIIEESLFKNNTSLLDEGILYDYNGNVHVKNTKFFNNTAEDLFKGSTTVFQEVTGNEYKGNYLKIYLNNSLGTNENNFVISGRLETDKIYNTSVKSGKLYLYQNNSKLCEEEVLKPEFIIEYPYNKELRNLILNYDGVTDFRNKTLPIDLSYLDEKYTLEITNITKSFIYGDNITFNIKIRNTGNVKVKNIILNNVLPKELTYINSTDNFDKENNTLHLSLLEVNENRSITFYLLPNRYEDLNLEFNIYSRKENKTYTFLEDIVFIKPEIRTNTFISHPGDVTNITATINNYNKNSIDNIHVIFNYKEIKNITYSFKDNYLIIEKYKLSESLTKKKYMLKIICDNDNLEEFSDTTLVSVIKYNTHSFMNCNISNSYMNLSVKVVDENDNNVNAGSVALKINGKTVKILKVKNGMVVLENYKLKSNYNNKYDISLTFTGNNKYNLHYNNISVKESKKTVHFIIDYTITDKLYLSVKMLGEDNVLPESGLVAIKINDKTILPKMDVNESYNIEYDISNILSINSISACYYGNENFLEARKTITV
ncbi:MAG: hypothetical protein IJI98_07225 [Methanosphaera sp.]|nr:hypothetical protein [Methanosphaera sp.]